ncbi:hypothetical protein LWC34_29960 [Kibdelosporangium philippinense]|uniref:Uncharacterized protein n=1 Tax=Kibdelosporangium philippinense TaxID=211113 RepID=A0ABS8ZGR7_9PSEU|nr:hypothetical protein [Kibdelosporangium philippinense]MCE7007024.1 hypothetical protein [Kibdelosporangium philippinense]
MATSLSARSRPGNPISTRPHHRHPHPIYLGVVLPGPWFLRHRDNPQIKTFVAGATAAAAGAIAGAVIVLSRQTITDWPGAASP